MIEQMYQAQRMRIFPGIVEYDFRGQRRHALVQLQPPLLLQAQYRQADKHLRDGADTEAGVGGDRTPRIDIRQTRRVPPDFAVGFQQRHGNARCLAVGRQPVDGVRELRQGLDWRRPVRTGRRSGAGQQYPNNQQRNQSAHFWEFLFIFGWRGRCRSRSACVLMSRDTAPPLGGQRELCEGL
nr:hypothetical protein [Microbulbifer sp. GX H0434]